MNIILEGLKSIDLFLGEPELAKSEYVHSIFNYIFEYNNVFLLHNTFTKKLLVLDKNEYEDYKLLNKESDVYSFLIKDRFFVPKNTDEHKIFLQIHKIVTQMQKKDYINSFTIFTTTDCNARCYYCFEHGIKKIAMCEKTALDVAKYIIKASKGQKVKIKWYGGEPLYNYNCIDIISDYLEKSNVEFTSNIVTNAYLFTQPIIKKAIENWKIESAQIAFDGTENKYNLVKNYIYKDDESPYLRVLENIKNLLINGITVLLAINLTDDTLDDCIRLVDELSIKFSKYKNFKIVPSYVVDNNVNNDYKKRYENYTYLNDYVRNKKLDLDRNLNLKITGNTCMANDKHSIFILPDGQIGKCNMLYKESVFGNIYSDNVDTAVLDRIFEKHAIGKECHDCAFFPNCNMLISCPTTGGKPCNKLQKNERYNIMKQSLINIYKKEVERDD